MKITPEDLKASYRNMSDEELLAMNRDELTDMARQCYDGEIERRGLSAEGAEADSDGAFDEPLVVVFNATSSDEAWSVVTTLERMGLPARIGGDNIRPASWLTSEVGRYPVAVPASRAEEARDFLNTDAPEEIIVTARYENGVFKPIEEVEIAEGTVVEIHVPAEAFGAEES